MVWDEFYFISSLWFPEPVFHEEIPMLRQNWKWSFHLNLWKPLGDGWCHFVDEVFCCETTAKHCYEILLFFRFTAWKCFEFVKISKLLAKVTQNFKHRAVFLVTVPGNEAKICPFGLSGTDRVKSCYQWGLGLGVHSTCIRNGLYDSTHQHRDLQTALSATQQWGLYGDMGQEKPWADLGEGEVPAPASIAHRAEEFSGS